MIELFGSALVPFCDHRSAGCARFSPADPRHDAANRRPIALASCVIRLAVLMFFALLGKPMLHALDQLAASHRRWVMLF